MKKLPAAMSGRRSSLSFLGVLLFAAGFSGGILIPALFDAAAISLLFGTMTVGLFLMLAFAMQRTRVAIQLEDCDLRDQRADSSADRSRIRMLLAQWRKSMKTSNAAIPPPAPIVVQTPDTLPITRPITRETYLQVMRRILEATSR